MKETASLASDKFYIAASVSPNISDNSDVNNIFSSHLKAIESLFKRYEPMEVFKNI